MPSTSVNFDDFPEIAPPAAPISEHRFIEWVSRYPKIRAEWSDGQAELLPPDHVVEDRLRNWLSFIVHAFTEEHELGAVFGPNFFVRLESSRCIRTPDLCFISKRRSAIVEHTLVNGAPDLVFEVVSPESQSRDRRKKYQEYEAAGVREYWIIDPLSRNAELYRLKGKRFVPIEAVDGQLRSSVLPGFYLKGDWLWRRPLPNLIKTLREFGLIK